MRRLLFSLISLGAVAVVAIGATRAYFTDTEVLGNTIETAKVNVNLTGPGATIVPVDIGGHLTGGILPGGTYGRYQMSVYNRGHGQSTVPVKYAWTAKQTAGNTDLFNILNVKVEDGNCDWVTSWPAGLEVRYNGPLSGLSHWRTFPGDLGVNITRCTWFTFSLPAETGNGYQGLNTQFNLVLDATQVDNPGWAEDGTF